MKKRNPFSYPIISSVLILLLSLVSCNPYKDLEEYEAEEKINIQNFLSAHDSLSFEKKQSGLYYYDLEVGTGLQAETHDTAYVFYLWQYINGSLYETNVGTDDTLVIPVNEGKLLAAGFDETITYMKEGGKAIAIVPSSLAFGSTSTFFMPYTPFIFQVYLAKLVKHP